MTSRNFEDSFNTARIILEYSAVYKCSKRTTRNMGASSARLINDVSAATSKA